jgi:hypothetical protein
LLSAVGIKLNAIAKHLSTVGDRLKRHTIADAGVYRRCGLIGKQEKSADPLGFGQGQGVEAESTFSLKTHWGPPFS